MKKNYEKYNETNRVIILSRTIVLSNAINLFPETLLVYSRFIQVVAESPSPKLLLVYKEK